MLQHFNRIFKICYPMTGKSWKSVCVRRLRNSVLKTAAASENTSSVSQFKLGFVSRCQSDLIHTNKQTLSCDSKINLGIIFFDNAMFYPLRYLKNKTYLLDFHLDSQDFKSPQCLKLEKYLFHLRY